MTEVKGGPPQKDRVRKVNKKAVQGEGLNPVLPDGREAYVFDPKEWETLVKERYGYISSMEELARLTRWHKTYSGKIPESWADGWYNIKHDLESSTVKITDAQVLAAIEYPHWQVQQALGMNRPLSSLQLNALALTHYHSIFTFEGVLASQSKLGASFQSIQVARSIFSAADNLMIEKAKLGIPVPPQIIV